MAIGFPPMSTNHIRMYVLGGDVKTYESSELASKLAKPHLSQVQREVEADGRKKMGSHASLGQGFDLMRDH